MTTTIKLELEAEIENLGTIKYIEALLDRALETITSNNGRVISARDLAYARIQMKDSSHSLSRYGSYIKEAPVYIPKEKLLFF